jgi:hypothetical protein
MVLSIIFLEDKHKILSHLSILYEYQQFFQHRRAERDSSKYRCRRYLVWSHYEIIWVKGQTRI